MHTHSSAIDHITEAIEATGVVEDAAAEFDLAGIADEAYKAAGETWDLTDLDTGTFWWIVQRHALNDEERDATPAEPDAPSPASDEIASALADAAEQVTAARAALKTAETARDQLLIRTARTGAYTQAELARMAGITRGRVGQILT